jgi:hypothetical protein
MSNYAPEVGQLLFGNMPGDFSAGDLGEACLQAVLSEIERVFWNRNQRQWDRHEDPAIPGITFRPYSWADCDCGYDEREAAYTDTHGPECYQREYETIPPEQGASWQKDQQRVLLLCEQRGIQWNDGWGSAVHCDCGFAARWNAWYAENGHRPTCCTVLPNLVHGDVEFRWYKHARRGVSVQRTVSPYEWATWLTSALRTVQEADTISVTRRREREG